MIAPDEFGHFKFQYGGNKRRVAKAYTQTHVGSSTTWTSCIHGMPARHASPFGGNDYPLTEKYNEHGNIQDRMYIYGPTGLLALVQEGIPYYFLKDHLGSTRIVVNGAGGGEVERYDYGPFGEVIPIQINPQVHYRFTGQELDEFSNGFSLHNFRARLFDSDLGRFYAMDPARQGWSPFVYAGNNPVVFVDRDGRFFFEFILPAIVLGAFQGATHSEYNNQTFLGGLASGAFWGGVSGAIGYGVGGLFPETGLGFLGNMTKGVTTSLAGSIGTNLLQENNLLSGWVSATASGLLSGLNGYLEEATIDQSIDDGGYAPGDPVDENKLDDFIQSNSKLSEMHRSAGRPPVEVARKTNLGRNLALDSDGNLIRVDNAGRMTQQLGGATIPDAGSAVRHDYGFSFKSRILISRSSFSQARILYMNVGHELVHAQLWNNSLAYYWYSKYGPSSVSEELLAYSWNIVESRSNGWLDLERVYTGLYNSYAKGIR